MRARSAAALPPPRAVRRPALLLLMLCAVVAACEAAAATVPAAGRAPRGGGDSTHQRGHRADHAERVSVTNGPAGCVPPAEGAVRGHTEPTRCPCLMRHALHSARPGSAGVDFLVMRAAEFAPWQREGFETQPRFDVRYTTLAASSTMSSFGVDGFFFTSGNIFLPENDTFILAVRTSAREKDCATQVQFVFESAPVACAAQLDAAAAMRMGAPPPAVALPSPPQRDRHALPAVVRVVGGTAVSEDKLLAASAVVRSASGECSASVIGDRWLLTAAHCGVRARARARVGGLDSASGVTYYVDEVIPHPDYFTSATSGLATHDVAVLRLDSLITGARPLSINAQRGRPPPGTFARAAGYGQIAEGWIGHARARELHRVDVPVVDIRRCRRAFARNSAAVVARALSSSSHLCAGFVEDDPPCQGDTCTGDSGGPLVIRDGDALLQIGLTSGGLGCARPGLPGVYVNVAEYAGWIKTATGGEATVVGNITAPVGSRTEAIYGLASTLRIPTWAIALAAAAVLTAVVCAAILAWCCCCWCGPNDGDDDVQSGGES